MATDEMLNLSHTDEQQFSPDGAQMSLVRQFVFANSLDLTNGARDLTSESAAQNEQENSSRMHETTPEVAAEDKLEPNGTGELELETENAGEGEDADAEEEEEEEQANDEETELEIDVRDDGQLKKFVDVSPGNRRTRPPQPQPHESSECSPMHQATSESCAATYAANPHKPSGQSGEVQHVDLFGVKIVALTINSKERLCLAQISNTLLKGFSYNEIHNRRVALGITCIQCTPVQLEMLRRAGAMPSSSRRCGMITRREAERLCRSFLVEEQPPELPENFYFTVAHRVNYGCKGRFIPGRYISSRAKCIECFYCGEYFSPNKFIFHSHKLPNSNDCNPPDSPNINSWRKHIDLDPTQDHGQDIRYAWEDVKSLFNGGTRRRNGSQPAMIANIRQHQVRTSDSSHLTAAGSGGAAKGNGGARKDTDQDLNEANQLVDAQSRRRQGNIAVVRRQQASSLASAKRLKTTTFGSRMSSSDLVSSGAKNGPEGDQVLATQPLAHPHYAQAATPLAQHTRSTALNQVRSGGSQTADSYVLMKQPQFGNCTPSEFASREDFLLAPNEQANQLVVDRIDATKYLLQQHRNHHQPATSMLAPGQGATLGRRHSQSLLLGEASTLAVNMNRNQQQTSVKRQMQLPLSQKGAVFSSQAPCNSSSSPSSPSSSSSCSGLTQQQQQPAASVQSGSFIYNQLYSQLVSHQLPSNQSQLVGPPANSSTVFDAQLMLRQQLWSNLLANLQCNAAAAAAATINNGDADSATARQQSYSADSQPINYGANGTPPPISNLNTFNLAAANFSSAAQLKHSAQLGYSPQSLMQTFMHDLNQTTK